MTDNDYREILRHLRRQVIESRLQALDERLVSNMPNEGAFYDLVFYLKHLREEIELGSDRQYRETVSRLRRHVETESGVPVRGIRIDFSPPETERYGTEHFEFVPNREFSIIAEELDGLINSLVEDRGRRGERGEDYE